MILTTVAPILSVLVVAFSAVALRDHGGQRKHERTMTNIRRLEIANGVDPADYWNPDYKPVVTFPTFAMMRSASTTTAAARSIYPGPLVRDPYASPNQSSEPEPYSGMNPRQHI